MRISLRPDGSLLVRESPALARGALLVGAMAVPWGVVAAAPERGPLRVVLGVLCGALMAAGALLLESRQFLFDRSSRRLHWRRSRLLSAKSGTIPFSEITALVAQPWMEDENPRSRRLTYRPVLVTNHGAVLLSNSSSLDAADFAGPLALMRDTIGLPGSGEDNSVEALVGAGRLVDAATLLRRTAGLSLTEATECIHRLSARITRADP
jgi:hypothetical protein